MICYTGQFSIMGCLRTHRISLLIITMTILGFCTGLSLREMNLDKETIKLIGYPGQLVFRAIILLVVPLMCTSVILVSGVTSLKKGDNVRLAGLTLGFFVGLQVFCTAVGMIVAQIVNPDSSFGNSNGVDISRSKEQVEKGQIIDIILDLFRNAVPKNIFRATLMQEVTVLGKSNKHFNVSNSVSTNLTTEDLINETYSKEVIYVHGANFIGLMMFSCIFGCAMIVLDDKAAVLKELIKQINEVIMKIFQYMLWFLLMGMFFWMCEEGLNTQSILRVLQRLMWYVLIVLGLFVGYQLVLMPLLYFMIIRKNPFRFYFNLLPVVLTAFGTASSAATLPVTMRYMEEGNKIHSCITRFVLPLGMTVHMDGGCLNFPIKTIFVAHWNGVTVDIPTSIVVSLFMVLDIIAAPGIPATPAPVGLLIALKICGISSPAYIPLIISVEWLIDRFRTTCNVIGDCYVAAFVQKLCKIHQEEESSTCFPNNCLEVVEEKNVTKLIVRKIK
ncbi:excitatory amino acid transporter 1-like isoform X3 [Tachypleus tridentatus]|uniref:excitatory amino acid transporter 1-like isoform X3 n=1 Tax=Tachypleus tridentatus TaxID=6853 RepID=UPI003FD4DF89